MRIPTDAIPLAVLNLDRSVLVLLFHGLDSTCLRSVLASPVRRECRQTWTLLRA